ncbi:hypothetical protein PHLCEN_2v4548 [Hermanssonia centrifuga]|uniref:Uncharacterized protein n=1 Tax=Hermanssonia centrifuga TaxID=98765 RepID=A0A2R6PNG1_9APHY|nr:hypothetical protein PHLCEN_2v4548 [Hermanssonia centrifuga]
MSPQTLTVLLKVDRTIVDSYYTQFMKIGLALSAPGEQEEASRRLLQVVAALHSQDGESYAHGLKDLIFSLNTSTGGKDRILQGVVEDTLTFLRAAQVEFRSGFLGVIFALLMEPDGTLRPTLLVILSALACEYLESSPVPPSVMLQGFASQLSVHGHKQLPDFLVALEAYEREKSTQATRSPPLNPASFPDRPASQASSHASQTPGKLRYTAYDAPKATPRLRRPSSSSSYSAAHSDGGRSRLIGQGRDFEDPMSRTITAGDLTLASEHIELQQLAKDSRVDLIALDSPFISEPSSGIPTVADLDFEVTWSKLSQANLRGWCESPIEAIVRQLQGIPHKIRVISADQPPFKGLVPA